jgi:hypothetical protein
VTYYPYQDCNTKKTWKRTIGGLFQFTCGHIKPLLNSVEPKALEKKVVDKIKEQKVKKK